MSLHNNNQSIKVIEGPQSFWECNCFTNYIHIIDIGDNICERCGARYSISRVLTDEEEISNLLTLG